MPPQQSPHPADQALGAMQQMTGQGRTPPIVQARSRRRRPRQGAKVLAVVSSPGNPTSPANNPINTYGEARPSHTLARGKTAAGLIMLPAQQAPMPTDQTEGSCGT